MKLRIMSDLHLEGQFHYYDNKGEDVVVLAGDISSRPSLYEQFVSNIEVPVITVPGNHEYYKQNFMVHRKNLQDIGYIDNDIKVIDDVHFICGTMWTDFSLFSATQPQVLIDTLCERGITDYNIRHGIRKWDGKFTGYYEFQEEAFTIEDTKKLFREFEQFLKWALKETEGQKRVVVTHFCPGIRSVHEKFKNNLITPYFSTEMSQYMGWEGLWIHGHTHCNFDYMVGDTRVICNPKGYGRENLKEFNPDLIVEI